jgi:hypothetical protein
VHVVAVEDLPYYSQPGSAFGGDGAEDDEDSQDNEGEDEVESEDE